MAACEDKYCGVGKGNCTTFDKNLRVAKLILTTVMQYFTALSSPS